MYYRLVTLSFSVLFLLGCNEKTEDKVGPRTPDVVTNSSTVVLGIQTLPDTVMRIGNLAWHSNIKEAFNIAKEQGKDVIVMVGEDSCRWCVKMKKRTLTDARVQEQMKRYVLVSIKRSDKEAVKYVPEFDGNIPSFFCMNNKQELLDAIVGYFKEDDFLEYIKEIDE